MKCLFKQISFVIFFLLSSNFLTADNPDKDFLITLNGSTLTGTVKDISYSTTEASLLFENDFGNAYTIYPATIYGFAFVKDGTTILYESKFLDGKWQFLKVERKGKEVSLYRSMERQLKFVGSAKNPIVEKEKNPQIWLQFADEQPSKVYRLTYKAVLRKRMATCPEVINRLGKRGFKFNDLPSIVELYNELSSKKE